VNDAPVIGVERWPNFRVSDVEARAGVACTCSRCERPFWNADAYTAHACVPVGTAAR
jgi:hypothetical protein